MAIRRATNTGAATVVNRRTTISACCMNVGYLGQVTALVGAIYRLAMVRFPSVNVQKEAGNTAATRTGRMGSAQLNCQVRRPTSCQGRPYIPRYGASAQRVKAR